MEMNWPFPINSQLNPAGSENLKDYSYTSPLLADGSNYPCKGYHSQTTSYTTTATYTAGQTYNMSLTGSAVHGGGSCQLSLSYDNGATFKVIESMIGGCPISLNYTFAIPSYAPASTSALFAWTWFNEIGNREMYMNCARVEIQAAAPGRHRRAHYKRQATIDSLPDLFVCNMNNGCTTVESQNVQFPNPGSNVVTGADLGGNNAGTGFTGNGGAVGPASGATPSNSVVALAPSLASSVATSTLQTPATSSTVGIYSSVPNYTNSTAVVAAPPTTIAPSTSTTLASVSSAPTASAAQLSGSCTPGSFACNSATSFSQCVGGVDGTSSYTYMGSVAAGTQCVNGQIMARDAEMCTPDGSLLCNGAKTF